MGLFGPNLPDGKDLELDISIPAAEYYITAPTNAKYSLITQCQSPIPTNQNRTTIGVGELVNLSFSPGLPTNILWTVSALVGPHHRGDQPFHRSQ